MSSSLSEADLVFVERQSSAGPNETDAESVLSDDSSIYVVNEIPFPSITKAQELAKKNNGNEYEQRDDILKAKEIMDSLKTVLNFKDKDSLENVEERLIAREHLDKSMEEEILKIVLMQSNFDDIHKENFMELKYAVDIAVEKMNSAHEIAQKGETTVKRAMEVIVLGLPVFQNAFKNTSEKNQLSPEVCEQLRLYQECREYDKQASMDIDVKQKKDKEAMEHLEQWINLAADDTTKMSEKYASEIAKEDVAVSKKVKKEIEEMIEVEIAEVAQFSTDCNKDLHILGKLQSEQKQSYNIACLDHKSYDKDLSSKIHANQEHQEELKRRLKALTKEGEKLQAEREFQKMAQRKAKEVNGQVSQKLKSIEMSVKKILEKAETAKKVMEYMSECGKELLNASIIAEEKYIGRLKSLEIDARERQREAILTCAVEKRLTVENCAENIACYLQEMIDIKKQLREAVQRNRNIIAQNKKENLKKFEEEIENEKETKTKAENDLEILKEKLNICDKELKGYAVDQITLEEMYDLRKKQMEAEIATMNDGPMSLAYEN